jgi:hypothetical protein
VQIRVGDVSDEEPEVERRRQQHEEAEDDLLEINSPSFPACCRCLVADVRVMKLAHAG